MLQDRRPVSRNSGDEPVPGHAMAPPEEQLKYIRDVMSRTSTFTAVPGWGAVLMGISALVAAYVASQMPTERLWLTAWMLDAAVAASMGVVAMIWKASISNTPLRSGAGRKFITGFLPALFVGAVLTIVLWRAGEATLLPGVWMLLYGIGTFTGGAFSVRIVPVMGILFIIAGTLTLFLPPAWHDLMMGATFGGLHIGFGYLITRHHGG